MLDPGETPSLYFGYTYNIDENNPGSLISPSSTSLDLLPQAGPSGTQLKLTSWGISRRGHDFLAL